MVVFLLIGAGLIVGGIFLALFGGLVIWLSSITKKLVRKNIHIARYLLKKENTTKKDHFLMSKNCFSFYFVLGESKRDKKIPKRPLTHKFGTVSLKYDISRTL